jgi:hypothetical protein
MAEGHRMTAADLVGQHLADQLSYAHPAHVAHRGAPLVRTEALTSLSPWWPTYWPPHEPVTPRNATLLTRGRATFWPDDLLPHQRHSAAARE